jgi:hypothetical protein
MMVLRWETSVTADSRPAQPSRPTTSENSCHGFKRLERRNFRSAKESPPLPGEVARCLRQPKPPVTVCHQVHQRERVRRPDITVDDGH